MAGLKVSPPGMMTSGNKSIGRGRSTLKLHSDMKTLSDVKGGGKKGRRK
jgi:hypothetical protein